MTSTFLAHAHIHERLRNVTDRPPGPESSRPDSAITRITASAVAMRHPYTDFWQESRGLIVSPPTDKPVPQHRFADVFVADRVRSMSRPDHAVAISRPILLITVATTVLPVS